MTINKEIKGSKIIELSIFEILQKFGLEDEIVKTVYLNLDNKLVFSCVDKEGDY